MFYLADLHTGARFSFPDAAALARWWKSHFGMDFTQLNITGKDTYITIEITGQYWDPCIGAYRPERTRTAVLRRYQVLDSDNRSVDIRRWDVALFNSQTHCGLYGWPWSGGKSRWHRRSAPSMRRSAMRAAQTDGYASEAAEAYRLNINSLSCRVKTAMTEYDVEDYYDRRTKSQRSKSWKDQTKSRRQYAKHKAKHGRPCNKHLREPVPLDIQALMNVA